MEKVYNLSRSIIIDQCMVERKTVTINLLMFLEEMRELIIREIYWNFIISFSLGHLSHK